MNKHSGVKHWKLQRFTALVAIPLMLWLVWSVVSMQAMGWSYETFIAWLSQPRNATFMELSIIVIFYHAALGVQVIIEDYVHNEKCRKTKLLLSHVFFIITALTCLWSIYKVAYGG